MNKKNKTEFLFIRWKLKTMVKPYWELNEKPKLIECEFWAVQMLNMTKYTYIRHSIHTAPHTDDGDDDEKMFGTVYGTRMAIGNHRPTFILYTHINVEWMVKLCTVEIMENRTLIMYTFIRIVFAFFLACPFWFKHFVPCFNLLSMRPSLAHCPSTLIIGLKFQRKT